LELGEIARHVFRTNRAMHAEYVVLDVCEHCINPEELRPARRLPAAARFDRQMHDLTGRRKRGEAREPVGNNRRAWQNCAHPQFLHLRLPEALQTLQQRALRATLVVGLDGGDK
jgi:hypothetical protein